MILLKIILFICSKLPRYILFICPKLSRNDFHEYQELYRNLISKGATNKNEAMAFSVNIIQRQMS